MAAKTIEDGPTSSRSKREAILASATTYFGRKGYEDSKWADVAKEVGIGSTALYHYFEVQAALPVRDHGRRARGAP